MVKPSATGLLPQSVSVALPGRTVAQPPAFDTMTGTVSGIWSSEIVTPVAAVRPGFVPTQKVNSPAYWFEMVRVDTVSDAAKVVQVPFSIKRAMPPDVERPMSQRCTENLATQLSVPVRVQRTSPQPAPCVCDDEPDPVVDQRRSRSAMSAPTPIMLLTEPGSQSTGNTLTIVYGTSDVHGHSIHQGGDAG